VKKGSGSTLTLFSNLNVNGTYSLVLGLYQGGGAGGSCCGEGGSLGGFVAIPDILKL